jgi:hypothetical protein
MNDFISRLAARAVGQASVAQPRPDVLLGEAEPEAAAEVSPAERAKEPAPAVHETVTRVQETVERASLLTTEAHVVEREPARTIVERERLEVHAAVVPGTAQTVEPTPTAGVPAERRPTTTARNEAVAAVPLAAAALPQPPAREEREAQQPARVHIGRLEIRATVQEQPKPQPRRREPRRSEGLSLGDYLKGSR